MSSSQNCRGRPDRRRRSARRGSGACRARAARRPPARAAARAPAAARPGRASRCGSRPKRSTSSSIRAASSRGQVIEAGVQDRGSAGRSARRRARTPATCSRGACGPPGRRRRRAAEERRLALGGGQQAGQHLHRRGLAAAVGAEEAEDLAALDREAHAFTAVKVPKRWSGPWPRWPAPPPGSTRGGIIRPRAPPRFSSGKSAMKRLFQVLGAGPLHQLRGRAGGQHAAGVHGDDPVEPLASSM